LAAAPDLHAAVERADPQSAGLLQRVAVEETSVDPDDVTIRLVDRAVQKELQELQSEMREAPTDQMAAYSPAIAWLQLGLERMRIDDARQRDAALEAQQLLVAWLVERRETEEP
jgi:hypothetical protein